MTPPNLNVLNAPLKIPSANRFLAMGLWARVQSGADHFSEACAKYQLQSPGCAPSIWLVFEKMSERDSRNGFLEVTLKRYFFLTLAMLLVSCTAIAQGVGINETGADPAPSAILDASSPNKGFLLPRITSAQRDAIEDPALGLQIYNTTTNCFEAFFGSSWQNMFCGCSVPPSDLSYTDNGPLVYCLNQGITPNNASTQSSTPGSYSVAPGLPSGLFFNPVNGQISGTPTVLSESAQFIISATNSCGTASRYMNIEVTTTPDSPAAVTGPSAPTLASTAIYHTDAVSGATSYSWSVPEGWIINSGQGTASISVSVGSSMGDISVTASNVCGTSSAVSNSATPWRPIVASGGTISTYTADGTNGVNGAVYKVHSFTVVGAASFDVLEAGTAGLVDFLVVAGGGGGGNDVGGGGGGGAGGLRSSVPATGGGGILASPFSVSNSTNYTVSVGTGGQGGTTSTGLTSTNGGNSSFGSITSTGGGRGGGIAGGGSRAGGSGGSGGGSGSFNGGPAGGSGTSNQGYAGAMGTGGTAGGGGGGAGGAGSQGSGDTGGNGGLGVVNTITGSAVTYAGGGGGCGYATAGQGGSGVGGTGGDSMTLAAANTGSGGGAQRNYIGSGGAGADGVVIIRYPITNPNP